MTLLTRLELAGLSLAPSQVWSSVRLVPVVRTDAPGDLRIAPYRIAQIVRAEGRDLYDQVDTQRRVFFVATTLDPGDSGAALIDTSGEVVGIAFAVAPGDEDVAYALDIGELEALLTSAETSEPVSTRDCV